MVVALDHIWSLLEEVKDPEIPVLSVIDLGIIRDIRVDGDTTEVVITPTYSGCPAMDTIENDIRKTLLEDGFGNIKVTTVLSPAWTTDWLTVKGRQKLEEYGIAPPVGKSSDVKSLTGELPVVMCPQCKSTNTELVSQFGSTACKAHYKCKDCLEPFDYFKCL